MARQERQPDQIRESQTQNSRSQAFRRGRVAVRCRTLSWWRSAAFSRSRTERGRKSERSRAATSRSSRIQGLLEVKEAILSAIRRCRRSAPSCSDGTGSTLSGGTSEKRAPPQGRCSWSPGGRWTERVGALTGTLPTRRGGPTGRRCPCRHRHPHRHQACPTRRADIRDRRCRQRHRNRSRPDSRSCPLRGIRR